MKGFLAVGDSLWAYNPLYGQGMSIGVTCARILRDVLRKDANLDTLAKRFYPAGNLAGPMLGGAGMDGHGLDGLEKSLDQHLLGSQERHQVLRDARGNMLFAEGWSEAATQEMAGDSAVLTIDRYVQYVADTGPAKKGNTAV